MGGGRAAVALFDAMLDHRGKDRLHVLGRHHAAPYDERPGARGPQQTDAGARRQADGEAGGAARMRDERLHVVEQRRGDMHLEHPALQLVLADEINRASPKAQSALLEAMEERQVTVDGQSMALPDPFFVIATQNPQEQVGTFPLPESQLDRFLMRVHLGYPAAAAERELLCGTDRRELVNSLSSISSVETLHELQHRVLDVHVAPALLDYVQALIAHTRSAAGLAVGLSPRAGIGLLRAARAWALVAGRNMVTPEHVQAVFPSVVEHRIEQRDSGPAAAQRLLEAVPVP